MATFAQWLHSTGLQQYEGLFATHDVDLDSAPEITDADLVALGLSLGSSAADFRSDRAAGQRQVSAIGTNWRSRPTPASRERQLPCRRRAAIVRYAK
jgi:hypothetical protein